MKKWLKKWLGIPSIEKLDMIEKKALDRLDTRLYDTEFLRVPIESAISGMMFRGGDIHFRRLLDGKIMEIAKNAIKEEMYNLNGGEQFIDSVIERINKKQLTGGK